MTKFSPKHKLKCIFCNTTIKSSYSGEFVACECDKCYIDETHNYYRTGGDAGSYELFEKDENGKWQRIPAWWEK